MKRLLAVIFSVPPTPGPNPPRAAHLTRYLGQHGWEAIILTPRHPQRRTGASRTREHRRYPIPLRRIEEASAPAYWLQETAYEDLLFEYRRRAIADVGPDLQPGLYGRSTPPEDVLALEEPPLPASGWQRLRAAFRCRPDARAGWVMPGVLAARAVCETVKPDAVYSLSPPVSAHRIAMRVAENLEIPWIADHHEPWRGMMLRPVDILYRERILRRARRCALPPSFDESDVPAGARRGAERPGPLTIVHAGSTARRGRNPGMLLDALRLLIDSGSAAPSDLRVRLVGHGDLRLGPWIGERALSGLVTLEPRLPWEIAMEMQAEAGALLLASGPGDLLRTPDRMVEAMSVHRSVLAFGPEPSPAFEEILRTSGLGAYHTDARSLAAAIRERIHAPQGEGGSVILNEPAVARYRAQGFVARIIDLLG